MTIRKEHILRHELSNVLPINHEEDGSSSSAECAPQASGGFSVGYKAQGKLILFASEDTFPGRRSKN